MKLPADEGELVELFGATQCRQALLAAFPDLESEIDPDDNVHMIMGCLERAVGTAVAAGDHARALAVLALLDSLLNRRDLDPEIANAISISFVEPDALCSTEMGARVWSETPQRIRDLLLAPSQRPRQ